MAKNKKKPIVGIFGLTSDEGCEFPIIDQGEKFLELLEEIELGQFRLVKELPAAEKYDVALVEGSVLTEENKKKLKWIRNNSRILVAMGACAVIGGIPELKNYLDKDKAITKVYEKIRGIDNLEVKPLKEYVKVDFEIPGCPVDGGEVIKFLYELKEGRIPVIPQRPVCYECQLRETECLLQPNEKTGRPAMPCLGPIVLGGCNAPCPKVGYPCDGCRGIMEGADIENFEKAIASMISPEERDRIFERYGNKDKIEELKRRRQEAKNKKSL